MCEFVLHEKTGYLKPGNGGMACHVAGNVAAPIGSRSMDIKISHLIKSAVRQ